MSIKQYYKLAIITVTHNSERYIEYYFQSLLKAAISFDQLIIIDSGSTNTAYLNKYKNYQNVTIRCEANVGFCKGNNIGYSLLHDDIDLVLFLNPDIVFTEEILTDLVNHLMDEQSKNLFAISPKLLRYIISDNEVVLTDVIDSMGINRTFYGRFYDINSNKKDYLSTNSVEYPLALCGAFMLCRKAYLDDIKRNDQIFLEEFFMYKEDIELCLRAKEYGYKCALIPSLKVYHGRGWISRRKISKWQKHLSVRNDFRLLQHLHGVLKVFSFLYYLLKYFYVKSIES